MRIQQGGEVRGPVTRSTAAPSGSPIAASREVCSATVFSTSTGRPGAIGITMRWTARRRFGRSCEKEGGGPTTTVRAAMAIPMPDVLVRQHSHAVPGSRAPVRTRARWWRSRAR
ncbi:hypothetical protein GCM10010415_29830 [Streptomyces atrovirens]